MRLLLCTWRYDFQRFGGTLVDCTELWSLLQTRLVAKWTKICTSTVENSSAQPSQRTEGYSKGKWGSKSGKSHHWSDWTANGGGLGLVRTIDGIRNFKVPGYSSLWWGVQTRSNIKLSTRSESRHTVVWISVCPLPDYLFICMFCLLDSVFSY